MVRRPLERQVMRVLWASPQALPGYEVAQRVGEPVPALTTVLTTLERLRAKKLVARERDGRVYVYRAVVAREHLVATTMLAALDDSSDRVVALTRFVDEVAPEDLAVLRDALARREGGSAPPPEPGDPGASPEPDSGG